jgi:hypothetical protein
VLKLTLLVDWMKERCSAWCRIQVAVAPYGELTNDDRQGVDVAMAPATTATKGGTVTQENLHGSGDGSVEKEQSRRGSLEEEDPFVQFDQELCVYHIPYSQ